jgi:flagellar capping protein FliD
MSPKVIIRQNGILVDNNNEALDGRIKDLKKQIRSCKDDDEEKSEELKEQLHQIYQEAKVMIDLRSKVLVFLEPPHKETWSILTNSFTRRLRD